MRILQTTFVVMGVVAIATASAPSALADHRDLGREVLAPNDGWASFAAGTTGGSAAAPEQVYFVDTRAELIAALNNGVPSSVSPSNPSSAPRETADEDLPQYFGVLFQVHDGLVDITNASDFVTVSWNRFRNHDKLMLIGSSDGATADRGKLRVTLHHNLFDGIGQRAPRVRFGQVHVYNNYYKIERLPTYGYSWGVGFESAIYAQNNFFKTDNTITPDQLLSRLNGTAIFEAGTHVNGTPETNLVDVVAAWNAVNDPDLVETVGWTPALFLEIQPTKKVPSSVQNDAGPFAWHLSEDDE